MCGGGGGGEFNTTISKHTGDSIHPSLTKEKLPNSTALYGDQNFLLFILLTANRKFIDAKSLLESTFV